MGLLLCPVICDDVAMRLDCAPFPPHQRRVGADLEDVFRVGSVCLSRLVVEHHEAVLRFEDSIRTADQERSVGHPGLEVDLGVLFGALQLLGHPARHGLLPSEKPCEKKGADQKQNKDLHDYPATGNPSATTPR